MKDIHSHILYGIDDGSRSIEESIELLDTMEKDGVADIILTPHYIENSRYMPSIDTKMNIIDELKRYTNINLYIGNEVYISDNLIQLLKDKKISTLNNSRYLLIELPMNSKIQNVDNIVYELIRNNIVPIIAHPERYSYVQNDISYLDDLLELGVLFQGNYESLFGKYGKNAQKTLKLLLKNNYISFLGSDMHHVGYKYHTSLVKKKLKQIIKSDSKIDDLLDKNIWKVINNQEIEN